MYYMDMFLKHYGTPRHSGRYPWGSGENPYQHQMDFLAQYRDLKNKGLSETDIATGLGMTVNQMRKERSNANETIKQANISRAMKLDAKGYGPTEIGKIMGGVDGPIRESTIRGWLEQGQREKSATNKSTADVLRKEVDEKGIIDIGSGTEFYMGVSKNRLSTSVELLKEKGYEVHKVKIPQANNPKQFTTVQVLCKPGTTWADVYYNPDKIKTVEQFSPDGGETYKPAFAAPASLDSKRVMIRYAEEGGTEKDGVIELRRNTPDLTLGTSNYAQVRIAVDGTHYLKGMAIYTDKMPDGVDVIFNTNKKIGTDKFDVFKKLKDDPDNPFGATIKEGGQTYYIDKDGKEKLSPVNKIKEEGDWEKYQKNLSSQFLSKQNLPLIQRQLDLAYADKKSEFDEICKLTNAGVKKKLLEEFAENCDAAAEDLKAAALPRQTSRVILPVESLKDNEVYAPTFKNGEKVVLIRYPHAGTFEIPQLTVNNNHPEGKKVIGPDSVDAIGINSHVAGILSGADFDGDSVVVIPVNSRVKVNTSKPLEDLKNFDPKLEYPKYEGMKKMTSREKGLEMGKVSNLITDMTLAGATDDELVRAVKHSMVVIDAEKHELNWRQSEIDNNIKDLKVKYQNGGGAGTLISRASSQERVPERKQFFYSSNNIDPKTGEVIVKETGRRIKEKKIDPETGEKTYVEGKLALMESTKMREAKNANELLSVNPNIKERKYAEYANSMKSMANEARKEWLKIQSEPTDKDAKDKYKDEVKSINDKLTIALKNSPRERAAQVSAYAVVQQKIKDNPELTLKENKDELKKVRNQAIANARVRYGAKKTQIVLDDKEWEAIQNHAISSSKLRDVLNNTDMDDVRKRATPKAQVSSVSTAQQSKMSAMKASGYTIAEIAEACNLSTSTVSKYIKN